MKARTKTVEVIATRDWTGGVSVWPSYAKPYTFSNYEVDLVWHDLECGCIAFDGLNGDRGLAFIGGTYCGIKINGKKRLRITTTVEDVKA